MNASLSPLEIFRAKGIPNRRMEDWKYTDLRAAVDALSLEHARGAVMTVANPSGQIETIANPGDGLPDWVSDRLDLLPDSGAMEAAARAFSPTVCAIRVPRNVRVTEPLRIDFRRGGQGQIVLVVEQGASLTVIESHHADGDELRNISFSIFLEPEARLTHIRLAPFAASLPSVETVSIVQDRFSSYRAHLAQGGAKISRAEWNIVLKGEGAEAELAGASVLGDKAHADVTTRIDHAVGNTRSTQLLKSITAGSSRFVYQGKITVRPGANGSDSRQTAKALLLGAHSEADLKPELEIFADDVKCAHGAAVGDLDADSLFYLRSRGIPESESRAMLMRGFLEEAVDTIEDESLRSAAWEIVERGLTEVMKAQS